MGGAGIAPKNGTNGSEGDTAVASLKIPRQSSDRSLLPTVGRRREHGSQFNQAFIFNGGVQRPITLLTVDPATRSGNYGDCMATGDQLKSLLRSYVDGDKEHFLTVSMQVAANLARAGKTNLARELRELIDEAQRKDQESRLFHSVPITRPPGEIADLVTASYPKTHFSDMVLDPVVLAALHRVVDEFRHLPKLRNFGLPARRKLLLVGPPGSGKTMSASALAGELKLPLLSVRLDALINRFLGESANKLRQVFEAMSATRGVYFFDEFDAIGADRSRANDVGEMKRFVNSFLQFMETDDSESLIIAATNHMAMLDTALFRRFDDVIRYGRPTETQIRALIEYRLGMFRLEYIDWSRVQHEANRLSFAEVAKASTEAAKVAVLDDREDITTEMIVAAIKARQSFHEDS